MTLVSFPGLLTRLISIHWSTNRGHLDHQVHHVDPQPHKVRDLSALPELEWARVPPDTVRHLIRSVPWHLASVV